MVLGSERRR
jgi:hypothetical protein